MELMAEAGPHVEKLQGVSLKDVLDIVGMVGSTGSAPGGW